MGTNIGEVGVYRREQAKEWEPVNFRISIYIFRLCGLLICEKFEILERIRFRSISPERRACYRFPWIKKSRS
jgi:hypothetical protein